MHVTNFNWHRLSFVPKGMLHLMFRMTIGIREATDGKFVLWFSQMAKRLESIFSLIIFDLETCFL